MEPPSPPARKPVPESKHLLTVRSALIFLLSALCGLGGTGLLLAAHESPWLAAYSGFGVFGLAVVFWNQVIK
jgi:hypothetical protein